MQQIKIHTKVQQIVVIDMRSSSLLCICNIPVLIILWSQSDFDLYIYKNDLLAVLNGLQTISPI